MGLIASGLDTCLRSRGRNVVFGIVGGFIGADDKRASTPCEFAECIVSDWPVSIILWSRSDLSVNVQLSFVRRG
jgi:hypothetical protein